MTDSGTNGVVVQGGLRQKLVAIIEWRYFLLACLALAAVLRVLCILSVEPRLGADASWYYERAVSLARGDGYVSDGGPTAYWPVGFPAFLALLFKVFGASELVGKLGNMALYLGLMALSYALALSLFKSRVVAGLTVLALALWPSHVLYTSALLSETLYTFLTMMGIWLLVQARSKPLLAVVAGIAFGFATLTREVGWLVPLVAAIVLLRAEAKPELRRRWVKLLVVTSAVMVLTVLPWTIRNYVVFRHIVPVSNNQGVNLYLGHNPGSTGRLISGGVFTYVQDDPRWSRGEAEQSRVCREYAIKYAVSHPARELELTARRFFHLYAMETDVFGWVDSGLGSEEEGLILRLLVQCYYMVIMAVFVVGLVLRVVRRRKNAQADPWPTIGLWLIAYWTLAVMTAFGEGRFHYPMTPWIAMYAAAALVPRLTRQSTIDNSKSKMDLLAASPELRTKGPGVNS